MNIPSKKKNLEVTERIKELCKPTYVCSHTEGSVTIETRLFGPVTPERIEKAKAETKRRANMLQPYVPLTDNDTYQQQRNDRHKRIEDDFEGFEEAEFVA
jgi:hypothetical protein